MLIFSIFDKVLAIFDARFEFSVKNYPGFMVQTWIARVFYKNRLFELPGPPLYRIFLPPLALQILE